MLYKDKFQSPTPRLWYKKSITIITELQDKLKKYEKVHKILQN